MSRRLATLGILVCLAGGSSVEAQLRYGVDLPVVSRYEWRGITRGSGMSLQPGAWIGVGGPVRASAGVWTNVQLAARHPTRGLGLRQWFGEWNPWGELSLAAGPVDLAAGWSGYSFASGDLTAEGPLADTHELYGRLRLLRLPVILPSVSYFHDVDAYDGGYLEPAISLRLPVWQQALIPVGSLYVTARAGFSLGQEVDPADPGAPAHFADRGLTHWDVSLAAPLRPFIAVGPFELAPTFELHWQHNRDPVTRVKVRGGDEDGATVWVRFGLTAVGPRCNPRRQVCAG